MQGDRDSRALAMGCRDMRAMSLSLFIWPKRLLSPASGFLFIVSVPILDAVIIAGGHFQAINADIAVSSFRRRSFDDFRYCLPMQQRIVDTSRRRSIVII